MVLALALALAPFLHLQSDFSTLWHLRSGFVAVRSKSSGTSAVLPGGEVAVRLSKYRKESSQQIQTKSTKEGPAKLLRAVDVTFCGAFKHICKLALLWLQCQLELGACHVCMCADLSKQRHGMIHA
jgi:hypothetical protein